MPIVRAVSLLLLFSLLRAVYGDVEGEPYVKEDADSFRVRRIGLKIRGSWDRPEFKIPPELMLPESVLMEIRKKGYEILGDAPREYPLIGEVRISYEIKGTGGKQLEAAVEGKIALVYLRDGTTLWGVKTTASTVTNAIGPPLTPDKIDQLVQQFYKGAFESMPQSPRFKMVVGAPYRFVHMIKSDARDAPVDRLSSGRIIREILAGRWEGVPGAIHHTAPGSSMLTVRIWNDSDEQLTVCYKGTMSVDVILAPHSEQAFHIRHGFYEIGARAGDPAIVPLYAREELSAGKEYSVRFAISEGGY